LLRLHAGGGRVEREVHVRRRLKAAGGDTRLGATGAGPTPYRARPCSRDSSGCLSGEFMVSGRINRGRRGFSASDRRPC
jgi:hypothetical protein